MAGITAASFDMAIGDLEAHQVEHVRRQQHVEITVDLDLAAVRREAANEDVSGDLVLRIGRPGPAVGDHAGMDGACWRDRDAATRRTAQAPSLHAGPGHRAIRRSRRTVDVRGFPCRQCAALPRSQRMLRQRSQRSTSRYFCRGGAVAAGNAANFSQKSLRSPLDNITALRSHL